MLDNSYKVLIKGNRRVIPFNPPLHSDDEHYTSVMICDAEHVHVERVRRDAIRTVRDPMIAKLKRIARR